MKLNKSNKYIDIVIIIYICSYFGVFASYKGIVLLSCFFVLLCLVLDLLQSKRVCFQQRNDGILWLILYAYISISSLFNAPNSLLYLPPLTLGYIVLFRKTQKLNWSFVLEAIKIIAIILAISIYLQMWIPNIFYSIARYWFYYSNQYDFVYRTHMISHQCSGLFYEVSFSAFVVSLGLSVTFIECLFKKKNKVINLFLTLLLYGAVILTGKRSFMLLLPVLMVLFVLYFNPKKTFVRYLLGGLGILVFISISGTIFDWIFDILSKGQSVNGIMLSGREKYWNLAIEMFKDNPLFGKGINSYDVYFNNTGIKDDYFIFAGAHNSYFQIFAELGLLGGGFFIVLCVLEVIRNIKIILTVSKEDTTLLIYSSITIFSLLFISVYAITGNVMHQPQQLVAVFFYFNIINTIWKDIKSNKKGQI